MKARAQICSSWVIIVMIQRPGERIRRSAVIEKVPSTPVGSVWVGVTTKHVGTTRTFFSLLQAAFGLFMSIRGTCKLSYVQNFYSRVDGRDALCCSYRRICYFMCQVIRCCGRCGRRARVYPRFFALGILKINPIFIPCNCTMYNDFVLYLASKMSVCS